jgi:hypothetical protein
MADAQLQLFQSCGSIGKEVTYPVRSLEFKRDDPMVLSPSRFSPLTDIAGGDHVSYEIWLRLLYIGTDPEGLDVKNLKFWFESPSARWFAVNSGVDLKYKHVAVFAQPSNIGMALGTSIRANPTLKVVWTTPHASNWLNEANPWTHYLVLQVTLGSANIKEFPCRFMWEYTV